jgi:putative sterol carrier protein
VSAGRRSTASGRTTDSTAELLAALAERREPVLKKAKGTIRLDLASGARTDHWLIEVDRGDIAVRRKQAQADCVVHADKALFDRISRGEVNAWAAMLRGALWVEGDPHVLVLFQRLLPGPTASGEDRPAPSAAGAATA